MMVSPSFHRRVAVAGALALIALIGCGGSHHGTGLEGPDDPDYTFSESSLGCNDSLDISIKSGTFPVGSTVTFQNSVGKSFDGSAVAIDGGKELDCGIPSNAPTGDYTVLLNGKNIGTVHNSC